MVLNDYPKLIQNPTFFRRNEFGSGGKICVFKRNLDIAEIAIFRNHFSILKLVAKKTKCYLLFLKVLQDPEVCVATLSVVLLLRIVASLLQ